MVFIEEELFQYKRKNSTIYVKLLVDFIGSES
jgi:hypothetical protein